MSFGLAFLAHFNYYSEILILHEKGQKFRDGDILPKFPLGLHSPGETWHLSVLDTVVLLICASPKFCTRSDEFETLANC